ncbi:MAG: hypothetical protein HZB53_10635 [Chloroflexi bacterium]|nr:hypothetical protein [Chloroflexota bacterium]
MSADDSGALQSLEELARRLTQQLSSYEALHAAEARTVKEQWEKLQSIQQDELRMLREELAQLKGGIAALRASLAERHGASGGPAGTEPKDS